MVNTNDLPLSNQVYNKETKSETNNLKTLLKPTSINTHDDSLKVFANLIIDRLLEIERQKKELPENSNYGT